ncbi:glycosyltransferase family 4 protein [Acidipropionibacterium timonense]|uniref:glycosyltransferase family 4 protein n=1 Tax=Acidipropionibacterium timonense TaxID=2161818 RepID=UPI001FDA3606|nr:glycosyltransferase [Acidipropionibacterium timonense]
MSRPFTIASNQGTMGGGEVMLLAIAEAARDLGRDVTIVAPRTPGDVAQEARRRGFRVVEIHGDTTASYLRNLRRWDAAERQGLLWCNGLRPAFATSGHPNRVVHLHQEPVGKLKALARVARRGARRVIVPSQFMAARVPGATVMWNWTDEVPPRTRNRDLAAPLTIGYLGRLSSDKGVPVLCRAVSELERRHPGRYRLLLAGESRFVAPSDAERVGRAVAALGVLVDSPGWMSRDDFFSRTDIAVFPSVWGEPFGLVVNEAQSTRCPFVISDAGALPEVAGPYLFVARHGDPIALADAIERAADADWDIQLAASRARWEQHFSPAAGRERLGEVLESLEPPRQGRPGITVVHDYLTQRGGAERVALSLAQVFPDAPVVTSLYEPDLTYPEFADHDIRTSALNRVGALRRHFRAALPLFGWAFDHTSLPLGTDVAIVSTTGFAHGIPTPPGCRKIVYCHSPARFLYLVDDYLGGPWWSTPKGWLLKGLLPALTRWDQRAAASADVYLCNSTVVQRRIKDVYGIDATVVHPPHALDPGGEQEPVVGLTPGFFLTVSRLMPYKNVDVLLDTFRRLPGEHLVVVGRGPLRDTLHADAPTNVTFLEGIPDAQLRWLYAHAAAVIAPSKEDFGLTPVEGFSFGTPCLALRAGGYLDTVVDGVTGLYFDAATAADVLSTVHAFRTRHWDRQAVLEHAEHFSPLAFARSIEHYVELVTTRSEAQPRREDL